MIKQEIYDLERKIQENRIQLNNLSFNYMNTNENNDIIRDKIRFLEIELTHLNNQLSIIKNSYENVQIENNKVVQETKQIHTEPSVQPITNQQTIEEISNYVQNVPPRIQNNFNLEKMLAKSGMSIFASILIFISICLFGTWIIPQLNDELKMIIMFGISGIILTFGLLKLKKDETNKGFLAITGCGLGAVYLSLIISRLYFNKINDIVLFILILIWAIFVKYLTSKLKNNLFLIIGEIGVTFSVFLGVVNCINEIDFIKYLLIHIFYLITYFTFFKYEKNYNKNLIIKYANLINLITLTFACYVIGSYLDGQTFIIQILLFLFILFNIFIETKSELNKNHLNISYLLINITYIILTFIYCNSITNFIEEIEIVNNILSLIALIGLFIYYDFKLKDNFKGIKSILQIFISFFLVWTFNNLLSNYGILICVALFLIYSIYKKEYLFQIVSLVLIFGLMVDMTIRTSIILCILYLCIMFGYMLCINFNLIKYHIAIKNVLIAFFYITIVSILNNKLYYILDYKQIYVDFFIILVLTILHIVFQFSKFKLNIETLQEEKFTNIYINFINIILWIEALNIFYNQEMVIITLINLLIVLTLCFLKTSKYLKEISIYSLIPCFKYTITLMVILNYLDAINMVFNVIIIILFIVLIVLGFKFENKYFRLYGLIGTIIFVLKSILVDINYDNMLFRIIGFFISGILCFIITQIYQKLDKKLK